MSYPQREVILTPAAHAKHKWYDLQPGQILTQCSSGFLWNETISTSGPHNPYEVRVIKEFEAHILVEAVFAENGKECGRYRESINKCAVRGGYCYFLVLPEGV